MQLGVGEYRSTRCRQLFDDGRAAAIQETHANFEPTDVGSNCGGKIQRGPPIGEIECNDDPAQSATLPTTSATVENPARRQ